MRLPVRELHAGRGAEALHFLRCSKFRSFEDICAVLLLCHEFVTYVA